MSTDVSTTRQRRPWACTSGHRSHMSQAAALRCDLERARKVAAKRARLIFRPLPADQRDDAKDLPRGAFDWKAFRESVGGLLMGYGAILALPVAAVAVARPVQLGIGWLIDSGHDQYMWAAFALLAAVLVGVWVVRQPKVRAAWAWLREYYS